MVNYGQMESFAHGFEVREVAQRLTAGNGGYEIVHESPGLEVGVFVLAAQTPFAVPSQNRLKEVFSKSGDTELVGASIYDKDKTTFRSEIDQALRTKPDMIYLNGYTPDCTIVLKELFKAGARDTGDGGGMGTPRGPLNRSSASPPATASAAAPPPCG